MNNVKELRAAYAHASQTGWEYDTESDESGWFAIGPRVDEKRQAKLDSILICEMHAALPGLLDDRATLERVRGLHAKFRAGDNVRSRLGLMLVTKEGWEIVREIFDAIDGGDR